MMMTYLQKSRRPKKKNFLYTISIAVVAVALALTLEIFGGGVIGKMALSLGGPFAKGYLGAKNNLALTGAFFESRLSLVDENRRLRQEIEDNKAKLLRFESVSHEYAEILAAYNRSPFGGNVILGNVISRPPQSPYDILIVDVGAKDGAVLGSKAYGLGGIPIGRVKEVANSDSKIVLFSSVGEENEVILERTSAPIKILGTGGGNIKAEVPQEMDITKGDLITLSQFNGAVIAEVVEVESSVTSSFKNVLFRAPINVFDLRFVELTKADE